MTDRLHIALAQINPHVGAVAANAARIKAVREAAAKLGADLVVTPEFSLGGYPPEDLARHPGFIAACEAALAELAALTADGGPGLIVGGPWAEGGKLFNAACLLDGGRIVTRRAKHELPRQSIFDVGPAPGPVSFRGTRLGLMIGEDAWGPAVPETLAESGAEILLCIDADRFITGQADRRLDQAVARVVETGLPFIRVAQWGGQDGQVFAGGGFVLNADRSLAISQPLFAEALTLAEWRRGPDGWTCAPLPLPAPLPPVEQTWRAMMLGLADYAGKNGYPGVVVDLAGGLGAALSATCAVDALGAERVRAVLPRAAAESLDDAAACARMLGIVTETLPLGDDEAGRMRWVALMTLCDQRGDLLLDTTDKTGLALGQGTLPGGFSVVADIWRGGLPDLARWRNAQPGGPVLPERLLAGADASTDAILAGLVEEELDAGALALRGFDHATVLRLWRLVDRAEYKRRQAPPGVTLGHRAFGLDRRYPLTNGLTNLIP